jgi:hypothetical protein
MIFFIVCIFSGFCFQINSMVTYSDRQWYLRSLVSNQDRFLLASNSIVYKKKKAIRAKCVVKVKKMKNLIKLLDDSSLATAKYHFHPKIKMLSAQLSIDIYVRCFIILYFFMFGIFICTFLLSTSCFSVYLIHIDERACWSCIS